VTDIESLTSGRSPFAVDTPSPTACRHRKRRSSTGADRAVSTGGDRTHNDLKVMASYLDPAEQVNDLRNTLARLAVPNALPVDPKYESTDIRQRRNDYLKRDEPAGRPS
jgi:hypothetical protein